MKRILFILVLLSCLTGHTQEKPKIAFGPYIQQMSTNGATICWTTIKSEPSITDSMGVTNIIREYEYHKIHLGGLKPDSKYDYDVLNDGSDEGKGVIHTYPAIIAPFNFAVTGDSRNRHEVHAKIVEGITKTNPRFIINSGDLVANGRSISDWEAFFKVNKEFMKSTPYYPVLGNHERDSPYYYDLFDLPNNEKYYYFTVGDALFIILDSEGKQIDRPVFVTEDKKEEFWKEAFSPYFIKQKAWLQDVLDLNKQAGFVFIFQHKPLYSAMSSRRAEAERTRAFWGEIFEKNKVQVFMNGHDHHYHRAYKNGVHYITSAGAGAPLYNIDAPLPETVISSKIEHFVNVRILEDKALLEVVDINGNEIETVEVLRRD